MCRGVQLGYYSVCAQSVEHTRLRQETARVSVTGDDACESEEDYSGHLERSSTVLRDKRPVDWLPITAVAAQEVRQSAE